MKFSILATFSLVTVSLAGPVALPEPALVPVQSLEERQTPLNAFLDILLDFVPPIDGTINAVTGVLTYFEQVLAKLTGAKTTYNDLSGACKAYTLVFARGTSDPGNVGILVGPPFIMALQEKFGTANLAVQGVNDYPADVNGYISGGSVSGSKNMAASIQTAYTKCPNTKLIVGGYSQGGQVVHLAAALLPANVAAWVKAVVIFGDPNNGKALPNIPASKVKTYCSAGDNICVNGILILTPHLLYGTNAADAAAFVATK